MWWRRGLLPTASLRRQRHRDADPYGCRPAVGCVYEGRHEELLSRGVGAFPQEAGRGEVRGARGAEEARFGPGRCLGGSRQVRAGVSRPGESKRCMRGTPVHAVFSVFSVFAVFAVCRAKPWEKREERGRSGRLSCGRPSCGRHGPGVGFAGDGVRDHGRSGGAPLVGGLGERSLVIGDGRRRRTTWGPIRSSRGTADRRRPPRRPTAAIAPPPGIPVTTCSPSSAADQSSTRRKQRSYRLVPYSRNSAPNALSSPARIRARIPGSIPSSALTGHAGSRDADHIGICLPVSNTCRRRDSLRPLPSCGLRSCAVCRPVFISSCVHVVRRSCRSALCRLRH